MQLEAMQCVDYILETEEEDFKDQVRDGNTAGIQGHVYRSAYIACHGIGAFQLYLNKLEGELECNT